MTYIPNGEKKKAHNQTLHKCNDMFRVYCYKTMLCKVGILMNILSGTENFSFRSG